MSVAQDQPAPCSRCGGNLKFIIEMRGEPGVEYRVFKCEACDRIECQPAGPAKPA